MIDATLDTLEPRWAELLRLAGDVVVARNAGRPSRAAARAYRRARRTFGPALLTALGGPAPAAERAALANILACLAWLDDLEPTPGVGRCTGSSPADAQGARAGIKPAERLRRRVLDRYAAAAADVRVREERIDRPRALARLAREEDADLRREIFLALRPLWEAVDGDGGARSPFRRLVRDSAERWSREGSVIEANAASIGLDPADLESTLWRILATWRSACAPGRVEPWDLRHAWGAAPRRLDGRVPVSRLRTIAGAHLRALGADPVRLAIEYDLFPRPGRPSIPVAFTMARGPERGDAPGDGWRMRPPQVFATYVDGGLDDLAELLHESGHAVHMAAVTARPAYAEFPGSSAAFLEATAELLAWDVHEPDWQEQHLGVRVEPREALRYRYGPVMLDVCWALFEVALHRDPGRSPSQAWTEITAEGLGVVPHPGWSWWAVRGQLIDSPGYLANYAFAAIAAAAMRERLRESRGRWWLGDPGWYEALCGALFRAGSERPPAELLRGLLGGPLTVEPLLRDLRRAA